MEPDDLTLLDRWRDGDAAAGHALFERHFDSIYRFLETKLEAEVDEVVQATFLACVRAKDQFAKRSSFRTYLFTIARHELYRALRERRRDLERIDFDATSVVDLVPSARTRIAHNQQQERLITALRTLPVAQQTLLELHYWEELDANELGEIFEVDPTTIRTRLHRARKVLRELMESPESSALASSDDLETWAKEITKRD